MNEKKKNPRLRYPKDQTEEARETLKKLKDILHSGPSRRNPDDYIPLEEAATLMACSPSDLLKRALSGGLDIYAPISVNSKYVWPVTDRGKTCARTLGHADTVFKEECFRRGDLVILPSVDIQHIRQGMDVTLNSFMDPDKTLYLIEDWEIRRKNEYVQIFSSARAIRCSSGKIVAMQDESVLRSLRRIKKTAQWYIAGQRMRELAKRVPWVLVTVPDRPLHHPVIRRDMLRVDESAIQRLRTDAAAIPTTLSVTRGNESEGKKDPIIAPRHKKRDQQIEAILAGIEALNLSPKKLTVGVNKDKEKEHKRRIREWCKSNHPKLFGAGDDRALFSGESAGNQDTFRAQMTFPDPDDADKNIFAHWHGKISHRFFRLHFEWPVPAKEKHMKILYLGPKITKK